MCISTYQPNDTMTKTESCSPTSSKVELWRGCIQLEFLKMRQQQSGSYEV